MTKNPLTKDELEMYSTMIPQAHFIGFDEQLFAFASEEKFEMFQSNLDEKKLQVQQCEGINDRRFYEKIYKATLQDYLIPKTEWDAI